MKQAQLHAYRTLVRIRMRRQEKLDAVRGDAQRELTRLIERTGEAAQEVTQAEQRVEEQVALIERLTRAGNRFQIADYLAQQDYQSTLEGRTASARAEHGQAEAAVARQEQVLREARAVAAQNLRQRERLQERVHAIEVQLDVAQMDAEDEEAEEAVVTRRKLTLERAAREAIEAGHA